MSTIKIEVTKNFYDVDLQQNVTSYDVTLEKGYYPLPVGGGGGGDTSNLVPYTGANKDVNIGAYYFETSGGFEYRDGFTNFKVSKVGDNATLHFEGANSLDYQALTINPQIGLYFKHTEINNNNNANANEFTVTKSEVYSKKGFLTLGGYAISKGTANQALTANGGVFDLNTKADLVGGKVPAYQLPSYVDDVLEFANLASFPATGESGKIYIAIDTNLTYRWGGSSYVVMSSSLALGETESTAFRGDLGQIAYEHSGLTGNPHGTTKADIGLGNVDNTSDLNKPISTATQNELNKKANIVDIPSKTSFTHDILVSNWTLVSGKYEAVISNAGILANSFVDVIPSNDHVDIVRSAQIYPSVLISEGSVKVYSKFLPSDTITVTININ